MRMGALGFIFFFFFLFPRMMRGMGGQESAPIELMIGVIVLAFVLTIAYFVYNNAASEQGVQKIRAEAVKLARAVEEVAQQGEGASRHVTVDFSSQGDVKVSSFMIAQGPESTCKARTGSSRCYMLYVFGNESGKSTVLYSELLENIGPTTEIVYSQAGGSDVTVSDCSYSSVLGYVNPSSGYGTGGECYAVGAGVHSFIIRKTSGGVSIAEVQAS